ncbi:MAG: alpha-xenorhabdolysin family binary toxin subunit A [Anaerolineae bacterium]|nr:alpha-xenorhabdolysin family binary toxin subunit A [Anaerolineae bacterium]
MTDSNSSTPNLGPSGLTADVDTPFILQKEEMLQLQCYVEAGVALPTALPAFGTAIKAAAGSDLSQFQPLVDEYTKIKDQCTKWKRETFPQTVSLASDIVQYNFHVPSYYNALQTTAEQVDQDANDEVAKNRLRAIIQRLAKEAKERADNAQRVIEAISEFEISLDDSLSRIQALDKGYEDKLQLNDDQITSLQTDIANTQKEVDSLKDDYDHYVVVAATTPTYAWIFPWGFIPGVVVAGVYGDRAVKALNAIETAENRQKALEADLQTKLATKLLLGYADNNVDSLVAVMKPAKEVVAKIHGVWGAIADDLNDLHDKVESELNEVIAFITSINVPGYIDAWKEIAAKADHYRQVAYIDVKPAAAAA